MISVVIIAKNEAHIIERVLKSLQGLSDDIVIVDNGSTDGTQELCKSYGARVIETNWLGYGPTKNLGIDAAKHDWILNIDADEAVDDKLKAAILAHPLDNEQELFECKFRNFFMDKWIRHGEWGSDRHIRLFNRKQVRWNDAAVHESLGTGPQTKISSLPGNILHYTVHSLAEYEAKTISYARLNANKYFQQHKKGSLLKQYFSPVFSFLHNYIIRLGFLDGSEGLLIARTTARYTYLKYKFLREIEEGHKRRQ